ncbi:hypothetical protein BV898_13447 [Hypsibius exemplaris]|uniref:Cytochrome b5 heme-binding domain-containing protein n=1 Tax=Hypsibius exemplaris TaxID=2072580 RepID=A0A1W0WAQ6_HYPEX|nr:hypothetical protein BV898_13447 [Hypsibius exemplaris]
MDNQASIENIPPSETVLTEEKTPRFFTTKEISRHSSYDSCWIFIGNCVYDVTEYLATHPGGWEIILEFAGSDATSAFLGKGHSNAAFAALSKHFIGQLSPEESVYSDTDAIFEELPRPEIFVTSR